MLRRIKLRGAIMNLLKDTAELMKEYNYEKNSNVDLDTLLLGSNKKIWWRCSKNHEWDDSPAHRAQGRKCPFCSNRRILKGYNDLGTTNPETARNWDYDRNSPLKPSEVFAGSTKKVWWICERGHSYEQSIQQKVKGCRCPVCSNSKVQKGFNDLVTVRPEIAREWDYEKNNLDPEDVTAGSGKKVWWLCPKCNNSYESTVANRASGCGCPYCAGKKIIVGFNDAKTWCIKNNRKDIIDEFDDLKNGFDLASITVGSGKQIWFVCPNGHSYKSTLHKRIHYGAGCGICSHIMEQDVGFVATRYLEKEKMIY